MFEQAISNLRVHRNGQAISLHKPLLLLLTISELIKGHRNEFLFDHIEGSLKNLLLKYGLRNSANVKPEYPFVYLAGNPSLWNCSVSRLDLRTPNSASRREILGAIGSFPESFYRYLLNRENAMRCVCQILNQFWPEAYHQDILQDLGLGSYVMNDAPAEYRIERSRKFVEEVLDAYERKCAICHQSIRLGDTLIGIDACHVKPIQHFGDDDISNGVALCKIHHWALDRGAISISHEMSLLVSTKLNGTKLFEYFTSFENTSIYVPKNSVAVLSYENTAYHAKYIFVH